MSGCIDGNFCNTPSGVNLIFGIVMAHGSNVPLIENTEDAKSVTFILAKPFKSFIPT